MQEARKYAGSRWEENNSSLNLVIVQQKNDNVLDGVRWFMEVFSNRIKSTINERIIFFTGVMRLTRVLTGK